MTDCGPHRWAAAIALALIALGSNAVAEEPLEQLEPSGDREVLDGGGADENDDRSHHGSDGADPNVDRDERTTDDREFAADNDQPSATGEATAFQEHIAMQAALEIEVGLRLYEEGDDYRAITALKRYRLLADNRDADHLSNLIIGDIYRRNEFSELALRHFWQAAGADQTDFGAHHLGIQELCVSLAAYASCHPMLAELEDDADAQGHQDVADLARYHRHFVEFVLGVQATDAPDFHDPALQRASAELRTRSDVFEDLPTKSPTVAGILSAFIPGAGQAYVGRWADAGLAVVTTGLFVGATAYSYFGMESIPLTVVSGIFTAGFYSGNIANAVVDARNHNARLYDDFFDALHRDLWPRLYLNIRDNDVHYDYRFDWPGLVDPDSEAEPPEIPGML